MGQQPDVIHIHEWHTSGVALLYWDMYNALGLTRPRIALTIHNMEHVSVDVTQVSVRKPGTFLHSCLGTPKLSFHSVSQHFKSFVERKQ